METLYWTFKMNLTDDPTDPDGIINTLDARVNLKTSAVRICRRLASKLRLVD